MIKPLASFLQDVHRLPVLPTWGRWPSRDVPCGCILQEAVCGLLAGLSSILHTFVEHLLYTQHGPGLLYSEEENVLTCLWLLWHFWGWIRAGLVGHVVLNTCSFCLLVSPCCLHGLGMRRGPEAQKKRFGDSVVEFAQMTL